MSLFDGTVAAAPQSKLAKKVSLSRTFEAIADNIRRAVSNPAPGSHPFITVRSPGFHASQFYSQCPRQVALTRIHGIVQYNNIGESQWPHLLLGTKLHELWQDSFLGPTGTLIGNWECAACGGLKRRGDGEALPDEDARLPYLGGYPKNTDPCITCGSTVWNYSELNIRIAVDGVPDSPEWNIVGHVDGLLDTSLNRRVVIDLKTIRADGITSLERSWAEIDAVTDWVIPEDVHWSKASVRQYYVQIQIYMDALDKEDGLFIYIPKDKLHDPYAAVGIHVARNPAVIEAAKTRIKKIWDAVNGGELPPRMCSSPTVKTAQACSVCNQCFASSR